jgi:RNA polymerase sigma-70 factor (ECF subfamily)
MTTTPEEPNWIPWLSEGHADRDEAIGELRGILLRGLKAALGPRGADDAFCEDAAQDSILKILNKMDSFEGRSKFTTWAMSIAIRTGISNFRRRHFKDVSLDKVQDDGLRFDPADPSYRDADDDENREVILIQLHHLIENELTEKQRNVVRALLGGMPVEEIASRTDSNRNAVYKLFHDARQRLKKGFIAADFSESDMLTAFSN